MDQPHGAAAPAGAAADLPAEPQAPAARDPDNPLPQDDDERFIVGLVLTYYRRHPQRARTRLLDLLGEVLVPGGGPAASGTSPTPPAPPVAAAKAAAKTAPATPPGTTDDSHQLWQRSQAGVAPLKRKR
jgi:hypothetical protein